MSVDPITADGNTGGNFNRYWYANNNPYAFTDPDGRKPKDRGAAYVSDGMEGWGGHGVVYSPPEQPIAVPSGSNSLQAVPMPGPGGLPLPVPGPEVGKALADSLVPLINKMAKELQGVTDKAQGPEGVQYSLRATKTGLYPDRNTGGDRYLQKGDVWKYGQTTGTRYSPTYLRQMNLSFVPEFRGGQIQIKMAEKFKIYGYQFSNDGERPPGNPIDR